ncbi:hypothetical protein CFOL_v3_17311, partial [Cephalotus follicularis]
QNHENRPTGSAPLPEVNATPSHFGGRGRGRGRGCGRGRGSGRNQNFLGPHNNNSMKWQNLDTKQRQNSDEQTQNRKDNCNRCGMEGHWYRACRTVKHWVDLYQDSLKEKDKRIETNF